MPSIRKDIQKEQALAQIMENLKVIGECNNCLGETHLFVAFGEKKKYIRVEDAEHKNRVRSVIRDLRGKLVRETEKTAKKYGIEFDDGDLAVLYPDAERTEAEDEGYGAEEAEI